MASAEWDGYAVTPLGYGDGEFDLLWVTIADEDGCDSYGGSQYRRAWSAWNDAGAPQLPDWLTAWLDADDAGHAMLLGALQYGPAPEGA
jgi:hypothetical protein